MHTPSSCYVPAFLAQQWLASLRKPQKRSQQNTEAKLYTYEAPAGELIETKTFPPSRSPDSIFDDLFTPSFPLETSTEAVLYEATAIFSELESSVSSACSSMLDSISWGADKAKTSLQIRHDDMDAIRRYFAFLRFRNSRGYQDVLWSIHNFAQKRQTDGKVYRDWRPYMAELYRRQMLRTFIKFLKPDTKDDRIYLLQKDTPSKPNQLLDSFEQTMVAYCWRLCDSEVCIGIAKEQEYILPECCFGLLDGTPDEEYCDFFCPLLPGVSLYILGTTSTSFMRTPSLGSKKVHIDLGLESGSDIHLRNALILQSSPERFFFSSKLSVALSISKFGRTVVMADYSNLLAKCKEESVKHMVSGLPDRIADVMADAADSSGPLVCRDMIYLLRTLADPVYS